MMPISEKAVGNFPPFTGRSGMVGNFPHNMEFMDGWLLPLAVL